MAHIPAINTVKIIILKPDEISLRTGVISKSRLDIIDAIISPRITLFFLAGGMIIAINIPYKATPNALKTLAGRMLPDSAPRNVPKVHPGTATQIAPNV